MSDAPTHEEEEIESPEEDDEPEEAGRAYDARLLRRLLGLLRPYKRYVAAALVLTIMGAPLAVAGPPLVRAAVDLYLAPDPSHPPEGFTLFLKQSAEWFGLGDSALGGLGFIAALFLLTNVASMFVAYAESALLQRMGQFVMYDLRNEIFAHLHRLPVRYFDRNPIGRLMTRLTGDVDALNEMFATVAVAAFGDIAMLLYIVVWMFQVNWRLALVTFSILPLLVAVTLWYRTRSRRAYRRTRARAADINTFLQERITGMPVVQLFNREETEARAFERLSDASRRANLDTVFYHALFYPAVEIVAAAGIGLIIWYGGGQVVQGVATLGTVIAFVQLVEMFYDPVADLSEKYNILQSATAASERIFNVLDEPAAEGLTEKAERRSEPGRKDEVERTTAPVTLGGAARGAIEFRHVWFAYKGEDWVLRDVSFRVEPGEHVAFVGHTGAGKTTIANLLLRFYEVQRGQILLDGVDVRELDPEELRSNFAFVQQDAFLFSRDIAANIRLNDNRISDEGLREAAAQVRADGFINRLGGGYRTELRERGAGLSGGQKQLIGLARALAFGQRVLIMDEATSSVDVETESMLRAALDRLMCGRTAIIIAHRLSTIRRVDKIIVLHKGEIRECGTHDELVRQRGFYWRLYQLACFGGAEDEA
jgi:ATP-binding cassette subfamily B protein